MAGNPEASALVGISAIASIADVGPSAVSNWRTRHKDFPKPKLETPSGALFDLDEVETWLREEGKIAGRIPPERKLWSLVDGFRGSLPVEEMVDLIRAALVYFVASERAEDESAGQVLDIPERLRWSTWWEELDPDVEVGPALEGACREVERRNPVLRGLLEPLIRLGVDEPAANDGVGLVFAIREVLIHGVNHDVDANQLYSLSVFEGLRRSGKQGSAYASSESAAELIASLVSKEVTSVFDPAAGQGEVLLRASEAASSSHVSGTELNARAAIFARSRFFIKGLDLDLRVGDSLRDIDLELPQADLVVCDPPFNVKGWGDSEVYASPRWRFGEAPPRNSDLAWVQLACLSIAPNGEGYVFSPTGALSRPGPEESAIRKNMIDAGVVAGIISLPRGFMVGSVIETALWLLRSPETAKPGRPILMISAETLAEGGRNQSTLSSDSIQRIADVVEQWREEAEVSDEDCDIATGVSPNRIQEADLLPGRYLAPPEIDLDMLVAEKNSLTEQARELMPVDVSLQAEDRHEAFSAPVQARDLGDLAEVWNARGSLGKDVGYVVPGTPGSVAVLGYRELSGNPPRYLPEEEVPAKSRRLHVGDVVFAARENGVEARLVDSDLAGSVLGLGAWQARSLNTDVLRPEWLYLWILSEQFSSQVARQGFGVTGPRMGLKDLARLQVPLPSREDQRRLGERVASLGEASRRAESAAVMLRRLQSLEGTLAMSDLESTN